MFKKLQSGLNKATKEVKKITKDVKQSFKQSTKEVIGEQYFPIIETTKEGMFKTEVTEKLIVLAKMAYRLAKIQDLKQSIRNDQHFLKYTENLELDNYNVQEGMFCLIDRKCKHIYFTFKGTTKGNQDDYLNNMYIFFQNNPNPKKWVAFEFVTNTLENFVQKNSDHTDYIIIMTGHSLGGAIAEGLALEFHDVVSHTESFNAGTTPLRKGRSKITAYFFGKKQLSNQIISHHIQYDPLSWGPVKGAIRDSIKGNNKLKAHSIDNFLELIFNFKEIKCENGCQICGKEVDDEEKKLSQENKLPFYCNLHTPVTCSVCQVTTSGKDYQVIKFFNKKYNTNQELRIHKDCWMCQLCGNKLGADKYICVDGFMVHFECEENMKIQLQQDQAEYDQIYNNNI